MARALGEIEDRLVGQMRRLGKSGNGGQRRRGAGGDDEAARFDVVAVDGDGFGVGEAALAGKDAYAEPIEALARILRLDRGDDVAHMGADRGEIDAEARALDAEARGVAARIGARGRRKQRLRRQRAAVEGFAAHLGFFDQHHIDAEGGRRRCRRKPARAGADDADVRFDLLPLFHCHFLPFRLAAMPRLANPRASKTCHTYSIVNGA